eukprot:5094435-Pyramimonas_sp.AAC.1
MDMRLTGNRMWPLGPSVDFPWGHGKCERHAKLSMRWAGNRVWTLGIDPFQVQESPWNGSGVKIGTWS